MGRQAGRRRALLTAACASCLPSWWYLSHRCRCAPHRRAHQLALLASQAEWSPDCHKGWPPKLQAATRLLLLAAWRRCAGCGAGSSGRHDGGAAAGAHKCGCSAAGLASLPVEVLLRIIQLAAQPVGLWV